MPTPKLVLHGQLALTLLCCHTLIPVCILVVCQVTQCLPSHHLLLTSMQLLR